MLNGYDVERGKVFYRRLTEEVASIPGVQSVGLASMRILEGNEWDSSITIEGYQAKPGENMNPYCNAVSPGYFATMGIPLLLGRDFTIKDERSAAPEPGLNISGFRVAIANEKFVKHYFGDADPIGRTIQFVDDSTRLYTVAGIAEDAPSNSSIRYDWVVPLLSDPDYAENIKERFNHMTHLMAIELSPGVDPAQFSDRHRGDAPHPST